MQLKVNTCCAMCSDPNDELADGCLAGGNYTYDPPCPSQTSEHKPPKNVKAAAVSGMLDVS